MRSGGTYKETPPAAPTVLTTPSFVDPPETPSAQAEEDSPTLSRRTDQEPPAASRNKQKSSRAASTTVPGECVPTSGLGPQSGQAARRVPLTKSGPPSYLGSGKPPSPQAHAAATADAFDTTQEYCTTAVVVFWRPPACFSQWTLSRFTIVITSYTCMEQYFAPEKVAYLVTTTRFRMLWVCPTPSFTSNTDASYAISIVWEHERENIVLVGSYAKSILTPARRQHLLGTGNRLLADASPYDTIWGISYRADHQNALCPPGWRGLNLLEKVLQIMRQCLSDRAPPPVRRQHATLPRGDPLAQGRDYIFEVDPSSQQLELRLPLPLAIRPCRRMCHRTTVTTSSQWRDQQCT